MVVNTKKKNYKCSIKQTDVDYRIQKIIYVYQRKHLDTYWILDLQRQKLNIYIIRTIRENQEILGSE